MTPPLAHPLLDRADDAPLFLSPVHGPVATGAFLAAAHRLAATLPPGQYLLNLCRDRLAFAVAFAAGLIAGRTALLNLPPEAAAARFPGCAILSDLDIDLAPGPAPNPLIPDNHPAAIVFTSGSTGTPTGHAKSWAGLVARTRAAAAQFDLAGGTVLGMVPPHHMYGFETTILLPLHAPVTTWCGPAFFPADIAAALAASPGPHTLVTTPLQLRTLLSANLHPGPRTCISATAPLDPALAAAIEHHWSTSVLEIFGATECGSIASRRTTAGPGWTPYPGITLHTDADATTVVAPGMDPVPLADRIEPTATGFRLLGRRTDLVKLGGRRASLQGLNHALTALPGVDDGAFLVPEDLDHSSTARLVAIVVAPHRTAPAILADLRRVIDPVFVPRRVIRVGALPRNALGKLPRQALLDLVAAS